MARTTNRELQIKVDYLNSVLDRPTDGYTPRSLKIDHYNPGDNPYQYKLVEMLDNGAYHEWTNYRMTKAEFSRYLSGLIDGINITR